jgi:hypothetical protein
LIEKSATWFEHVEEPTTSNVALEFLTDEANSYPLSNMIQDGGPSQDLEVWKVQLSIDQWKEVEHYLESEGLPYKFATPVGRHSICATIRDEPKKSPAGVQSGGANPCQRISMEETEPIITSPPLTPNQAFLLSNCAPKGGAPRAGPHIDRTKSRFLSLAEVVTMRNRARC